MTDFTGTFAEFPGIMDKIITIVKKEIHKTAIFSTKNAGNQLWNDVKRDCPVDTGLMKSSIVADFKPFEQNITYSVGWLSGGPSVKSSSSKYKGLYAHGAVHGSRMPIPPYVWFVIKGHITRSKTGKVGKYVEPQDCLTDNFEKAKIVLLANLKKQENWGRN